MRTWKATTKDGKTHLENNSDWESIKKEVIALEFISNGHGNISLPPNMEEYIQAKTASADLNGNNVQIESRYISFKLGNNIVRVRVDETNGNVSVEVD